MSPPHESSDGHDFVERASGQNSWMEWSRYVLKELRRISDTQEGLRKELSEGREELRTELMVELKETNEKCNKMTTDIALLQLKSGMAGVIGGIVVSIIVRYVTR